MTDNSIGIWLAPDYDEDLIGSPNQKQLSACLARYMDTEAFTATKIGKEKAERMKVRREIATKRARAAIRFFEKPENFARLAHRLELTRLGLSSAEYDRSMEEHHHALTERH